MDLKGGMVIYHLMLASSVSKLYSLIALLQHTETAK